MNEFDEQELPVNGAPPEVVVYTDEQLREQLNAHNAALPPSQYPANNFEAYTIIERKERDRLLREVCDVEAAKLARCTRNGVDTTSAYAALDVYIQELLDVPELEGFPLDFEWPVLGALT